MKTLVVLFSVVLAAAQVHADSKFAGDYYTVLKTYFSTTPAGSLSGAVNITVASDGSISGQGVFVDHKPVSVTGMVKDDGKVILHEGSSRYTGTFMSSGRQFMIVFPELTITGGKLAHKFPEAGVYHAKTSSQEELTLFVNRNHSVQGIVFGSTSTKIEGTATPAGFSAQSEDGAIFKGVFDAAAISGTFTTAAGRTGSLSGAKY